MRRVAALGILMLTACGGGEVGDGPAGAPADEPAATAPDQPPTGTPMDPADNLDQAIAAARADAAARAGVDELEVEVVTAEELTWSDGSLGCPEPGMSYTQALVDGYRVVLSAGGQQLHYHGAWGQPPRYCDRPAATPPAHPDA